MGTVWIASVAINPICKQALLGRAGAAATGTLGALSAAAGGEAEDEAENGDDGGEATGGGAHGFGMKNRV